VVKEEENGGGFVLLLEEDTAVERDEDTLLDVGGMLLDALEEAPEVVLLEEDTLLDTTMDRDKDTLLLLEPDPPVPAPGAYKLVSEKR
jgi:hypothetical protein